MFASFYGWKIVAFQTIPIYEIDINKSVILVNFINANPGTFPRTFHLLFIDQL